MTKTRKVIIALTALFAGLVLTWCLCRDSQGAVVPIFDAVEQGDLDKVKSLLAQKPELANARDKFGYALLHRAAEAEHSEVVEFLLASGADVNARTVRKRYTPLHIAAGIGCKDAVELLLASGADVSARNNSGLTALHTTAYRENGQIAAMLIAGGADVNARTDKRRHTPLHIAASEGSTSVVKVLLANGAQVNPKNYSGHTPLDRAVCRHHPEAAQLLREYGGIELDRQGRTERESVGEPNR